MVANGIAMQEIMKATQEETKISQDLALKTHKLSESMRKDSLSMKTVHRLSQVARIQADDGEDSDLDNVFPSGYIIRGKTPPRSQLLQSS